MLLKSPHSYRVSLCELRVNPFKWPFAQKYSSEIKQYWSKKSSANSHFFDGTIHLLSTFEASRGQFSGELFPIDFKSFLYWRDHELKDRNVYDIFGSALLRSQEGDILLGRQRDGHINQGFYYLPGGFIDPRDVEDQKVCIRSSILREVVEETGLSHSQLTPRPNFIITECHHQISVALEIETHLSAKELVATVENYLFKDPKSELEEVIAVSHRTQIDPLRIPKYASTLLDYVFAC